ncbi:hypothetical protein MLD38_002352 [Melastoma candidum]|uniref:Uncharacterized protein n=1 Tax=Melastoma candidum TaxID=119954 RepID=A0ACB9RZ35_9MYRT|nr:hypothetical protein MLD38_002352 [Melastoma candidum]
MPPPFPDPYCNFPQPPPPPPAHPHTPSRAVLLSLLPCNLSETALRRELEVFGEVRAVEMDWEGDGVVTVHFYDLRHAQRAVKEIPEQQDRGVASREDGYSHPPEPRQHRHIQPGPDRKRLTVRARNGPVKELRDTPYKKHQRFVEFYDVRDASRALGEMNGKEINGRSVVIEFSRPVGFSRKLLNAVAAAAPSSSTFPNPILNLSSAGCYPPWTPQHYPEPLPSRLI